ncbi:3-epi-6-deoxocathasterone 23-monooxygenase CYP90D1-like isoform X2 [Rhododendron vialii]|uniref:3-epi-6-deoxocathasterone 23-monooxygenase CYP90D1-like isoform X2 n=1 Tax=Rhododendron vialii TaxID=182163 RepID=UPI00265F3FD1|nr:3-epi-6-deoxocathasterone 23-monooxygenase CYP90D1-like isoform X2 [Rhododendron vialii]
MVSEMDKYMWILVVTSTLMLSAIIIILRYWSTSWKVISRSLSSSSHMMMMNKITRSSPPLVPLGNLGWPFLGETIEFISCAYSDRPESFMDKRRRLYGKVFKSHLFGSPTIVSTDAEVSKYVLQSDGKVFVPSYPKSLTELMGKSSVLLINGSLHRRVHGLIGAFFKSPHLKSQITLDMQNYVQESMGKWREDQPVYVQDEAKNIAFQVLVKALISLEPSDDMDFLKKQFQEFISGLMSLPINVPGSRLHKSLQAKKKMVELVQKIIQGKRGNGISSESEIPRDVADVLLKDESEKLTDELISNNMIDLMIPGEDSVPVLITLVVKYLSDCPSALQELTDKEVSNSSFTPFGGGQRLCPGLDLARLEASIFLHHFVTQFRWDADADSIVNFPTVRLKKRMPVWVKRREP